MRYPLSLALCLLALWTAGCNLTKPREDNNPNINPYPNTGTGNVQPLPATARLRVGTFDDTRTGGMSFATSPSFSQARAALLNKFSKTNIETFPALTTQAVQDLQLLILHVLRGNRQQMVPLSAEERQVLLTFVANGGTVLIMTDHVDFSNANQSFLAPFNMASRGVIRDVSTITVSNPSLYTITNGRFGLVTSFTQSWSGGFSRVPSNARRIAGNPQGDALVIFEPRSISNVSGAVALFSDVSSFIDDKATGLFADNETLFLNTIDYLVSSLR